MKIAIVGAGVMGCLVGAMLKKAGEDVWLINTNKAIVSHVKTSGLTVCINNTEEKIAMNIAQSPAEITEKMDLIIFLVKGCHTEVAAQSATCIASERTYVMTLQNGLGNVEILSKYYNRDKILYGILEFAGKMIELGHIQGFISGNSKICFGSTQKKINDDFRRIADVLGGTGIKVILKEDIDSEVWIKLRNNSTNAVFGILRLTMGQALAASGTETLMKLVRDEVIAVAKAKGVKFTPDQLAVNGGKTPINPELYAHLPSTARDMKNKVETEIEFINGVIYREGLKLGVPTPYNEVLYRIVKIMEETYTLQF